MKRRIMRHLLLLFALGVMPLHVCACSSQETLNSRTHVSQALFAPCEDELASRLSTAAYTFRTQTLEACFQQGYHAYVAPRVVEVEPEPREATSFGPWTAEKEYLTEDARNDGSLTEWYDNYYITHDWSDIGQQILSLIPGDHVVVNGRELRIEGIFNYPKDSYYDEIIHLVGSNKVVLQTCYPDSEYNRIVYGS